VLFAYFITAPYAASKKQPISSGCFLGRRLANYNIQGPLRNNWIFYANFFTALYAVFVIPLAMLFFYNGLIVRQR